MNSNTGRNRASAPPDSAFDLIQQFASVTVHLGFPADFQPIPDGRLHRVALAHGKAGRRPGWYVLYLDGVPTGKAGNWVTGQKLHWSVASVGQQGAEDLRNLRARTAAAQSARLQAQRQRAAQAALRAQAIWDGAAPCPPDYPYLLKKGIGPHGVRAAHWRQGFIVPGLQKREVLTDPVLLVPLFDVDGRMHSLSAIAPDGRKDFLAGGFKKGCYFLLGSVCTTICVAEGYATAASIHEATGHCVAVAFDCGNLEAVGVALRRKYPGIRLIFCADDDRHTMGNPGRTKAVAAARASGGLVAMPSIMEVERD